MAKKKGGGKNALADAGARADGGIPETDLTCAAFSLQLIRNMIDPVTHVVVNRFVLSVVATNGKRYQLSLVENEIDEELKLVRSLLSRIEAAKANVGWNFDAIFYPAANVGTITNHFQ